MLMAAGFWSDTYWPDRYWTEDYWPGWEEFATPTGRAQREPAWWPAYEEMVRQLWEEDDEILVLM